MALPHRSQGSHVWGFRSSRSATAPTRTSSSRIRRRASAAGLRCDAALAVPARLGDHLGGGGPDRVARDARPATTASSRSATARTSRCFSPDAPRRAGLPERFAVFFGQFPAWQGIPTLLEAAKPTGVAGRLAARVRRRRRAAARHRSSCCRDAGARDLSRAGCRTTRSPGVVAHAVVSFVPMVAPERETMFSPLKLYESMACGVPVVASDVVGISEVVEESRCGILVPAWRLEGDSPRNRSACCRSGHGCRDGPSGTRSGA